MRLSEHMVDSGDTLFRWRSYVPLVLLPLLLLDHYVWTQPPGRIWLVLALAIIPAVTSVRPPER